MVGRYINNSEKSVMLAEGLLLLSKQMSQRCGTPEYNEAVLAWNDWIAQAHVKPSWVDAVIKMQDTLFSVAGVID